MRITRQGMGSTSTMTIMDTLSDPNENHILYSILTHALTRGGHAE